MVKTLIQIQIQIQISLQWEDWRHSFQQMCIFPLHSLKPSAQYYNINLMCNNVFTMECPSSQFSSILMLFYQIGRCFKLTRTNLTLQNTMKLISVNSFFTFHFCFFIFVFCFFIFLFFRWVRCWVPYGAFGLLSG